MSHAHILSSSLVGGGSMNPDKLSLDLNFAADQSFSKPSTLAANETQITSRRGPAPAFSRGSMGTKVGPTGLIEYGPENLTFPSELLTNAPTAVVLNRVSGDYIFTNPVFISETTTGTLHRISVTNLNAVIGQQYIHQFYIKQNGRNFIFFNGNNGAPSNTVDLTNGNFTNNTGWTSTLLGNGWYKIVTPPWVATGTSVGCSIQLNINNSVSDNFYAGDVTKGVLFNGVQIERSTTARQYIPTTSNPVYGPRFDYDPLTLQCKGLLIEESRSNLIFPSDTLTTQTRTVTAVPHTLSFYGTGTVTLSGVTGPTVVTGTGAYPTRTSLTFTPTAGSLVLTVTGSVIFAQLEAGSFATSYIPTTTGALTRSADVCSISSSAFASFWNQSSGTLVESFEASPNINTSYVSASNGNIASNSIHFDNDTGNMRAVYYSGGSAVATLGLGSIGTIGSVNTIATAYSPNEQAAYRNGGTIQTATGSFPSVNLSQINIGSDERSATPNIYYSNKCIKSLRYYKKRLPNSKLQTLSV